MVVVRILSRHFWKRVRAYAFWTLMILAGIFGMGVIEYGTNHFTRIAGSLLIIAPTYSLGIRMGMWLERDPEERKVTDDPSL